MNSAADLAPSARPRGFWALIVTQFQGAFSDNVLKNLVIFMLVGLDISLAEKHKIGEMVGALFSLPFIVFSMAGAFSPIVSASALFPLASKLLNCS